MAWRFIINYAYNNSGNQVIAEYEDSGSGFILARKFIYGPGIDEPVCLVNVDSNGDETLYFYYYDGLGSVAALVDTSGVIVESYSYDAFGNTTITLDSAAIENPYMFTGRRYDPETKLYYYRARMYNPTIGRFLQPDPIGYGDGMNMYAYCGNNPVNWGDPSGEGVLKWLYTGDWSASDQDYDEATDVAASVAIQWGIAMGRAHKQAATYAAVTASTVFANVVTYAPILPKTASEITIGGSGASKVTTIVSRTSSILKNAGFKNAGHMFRLLARDAKGGMFRSTALKWATAAKITGTSLLIAEAGVGVYSGYQANKTSGIHTFSDGDTYDPVGRSGYSNSGSKK